MVRRVEHVGWQNAGGDDLPRPVDVGHEGVQRSRALRQARGQEAPLVRRQQARDRIDVECGEPVRAAGPERRAARCAAELSGAAFGCRSPDGFTAFHVDPVPRILPAGEWRALEAGLAQRVRALNAFVADVYGERRIVAGGRRARRA